MIRWGKNPAAPAGGGGGAGGADGEVAVQKVDKIEVHNLVSGPRVYCLTRATRGVEGDDINKKAEEFIKQRKQWFHRP